MAEADYSTAEAQDEEQQQNQQQPIYDVPVVQEYQAEYPRQNNTLQMWGNKETMNLNHLVLENIVQSPYFRNKLFSLKTFHEVVDEIYYNVTHLEPWEKGTRKTTGQTGMCGGVRGVGAGGVVSTPFCILYKLFTMKLTRKQLGALLNHADSPFIRGLGFMYIRFCQPPASFWDWYENYLEDEEEIDPKAGGGDTMTIGQMCKIFLTKLEWYATLFPRIPVPVQKEIDVRMREHNKRIYDQTSVNEEEIVDDGGQQDWQQQQQQSERGGSRDGSRSAVENRSDQSKIYEVRVERPKIFPKLKSPSSNRHEHSGSTSRKRNRSRSKERRRRHHKSSHDSKSRERHHRRRDDDKEKRSDDKEKRNDDKEKRIDDKEGGGDKEKRNGDKTRRRHHKKSHKRRHHRSRSRSTSRSRREKKHRSGSPSHKKPKEGSPNVSERKNEDDPPVKRKEETSPISEHNESREEGELMDDGKN